jgi:transcriptional regulator with XRE-family HTH domain
MQKKRKLANQADIGQILGKAIAEKRKALKLSQDDLAGLVEVDAETISRFERGAVLPSLQRLSRVAEALETGLGELLLGASKLPSDQEQQLVAVMRKLPTKEKQLLIEFANLLQARN